MVAPLNCSSASLPLPTVPMSPPDLEQTPDLVFTQHASGQFLSFYWEDLERYGLSLFQIIGRWEESVFRPAQMESYLQILQQVLQTGDPVRFDCDFRCGGETLSWQIDMGRILLPYNPPQIAVSGTLLHPEVIPQGFGSMGALLAADRYHQLLTRIAWSIRRTLDLNTIRQQTVDGLGATLSVSRCLVFAVNEDQTIATVKAEYRQSGLPTWEGKSIDIAQDPGCQQALENFRPSLNEAPLVSGDLNDDCVVCDRIVEEEHLISRLIVATGYQDQINGLIMLCQRDRDRHWTEAEVDFLEELADQVGTAIAHASLFTELQRANHNLVRKQEALEEARESAEEASRLKSEFLANTSHELRTPLNGMIGFLKLILDGMADDPEEQREFLEESLKSAEHLLDIINDVLDLAKIEAGKLQIDSSPVNLNEVLMQLEKSQTTSATQKKLSFEIQMLPTHDDVIVFANYKRLYQVLLNLVGNAIKFTHEGGITISTEFIRKKVTLTAQECPGMVMIRVADTGIGVSLEKQDRLFQSFSQVDGSLTRRYGGTGLGLAISQTLVHEMGGEVNFYSMGEGLGSTVTFTIPLFQEPVIIAQ
ncbi:MAG: ATP-binding protein [Synechococcales bacterium]|nr:ATP-binding protein [Synechococcales bacterium]